MPRKLRHWLFALKFAALLVIVGTILSGHPPSRAEQMKTAVAQTAEDSKQDTDIEYIKTEIASRDLAMNKMQDIMTQQGKDLASLDTKMSFIFGILGLLQGGGLALHGFTLKSRSKQETEEG